MSSKKNKKKKAIQGKPTKARKTPSSAKKFSQSAQEFWNQKSPVLQFLLGFVGCMILFYIIYLSPFFVENIGKPIIHGEAKVGSLLLNILGQGTSTTNDLIHSDTFSISVKNGCDGLEPLAILLSGILVFPVKFKLKWTGILWGVLALMTLNFVRIAGLYLAGLHFPGTVFDLLHEQGGFIIFTALSIFIWMFWANWAINKNHELSLNTETTQES